MSDKNVLEEHKFWSVLKFLLDIKEPVHLDSVCIELNIAKSELKSFVSFLEDLSYKFEYSGHPEHLLTPPMNGPTVNLEFSLLEWLQLQAHFPLFEAYAEKPFFEEIRENLAKAELLNKERDLFKPLLTFEKIYNEQNKIQAVCANQQKGIVEFLEEAIWDEQVITAKLGDKKQKLYPRKIVFIDGALSLVAEGFQDNCLVNVPIDQIEQCFEEEEQWNIHYGVIEIEDFISSLRAITESEVRLVLKVTSMENFDMSIKHHFLGNPCLVTNPHGEFIWAATIEPCDELHKWLSELGSNIEILDPISFKKDHLKYCESKLKKIA